MVDNLEVIAQSDVPADEQPVEVVKDLRFRGHGGQPLAIMDHKTIDRVADDLNGLMDLAVWKEDIGGLSAFTQAGETVRLVFLGRGPAQLSGLEDGQAAPAVLVVDAGKDELLLPVAVDVAEDVLSAV